MRVWEVKPRLLCNKHLIGEHAEIHCIWTVITQDKTGYRKHPETQRWIGKLPALMLRHDEVVSEMLKRGFNHNSTLLYETIEEKNGTSRQTEFINTVTEQHEILKRKDCGCLLDETKREEMVRNG